jgi:hypothetical protein
MIRVRARSLDMTVAGTRASEAARSNEKAAKRVAFFRSVHDKTKLHMK